jgi:vanillate O-demethylase monooxygenase subunit
VDTLNLHLATPETATTCHYWFWTTRNFAISPQANVQVRGFVEHAFRQQDKPMLEAQQRRIGEADFWSLKPVLLAGDAGGVRVRRKLQQMVANEDRSEVALR